MALWIVRAKGSCIWSDKLDTTDEQEAISKIRSVWEALAPLDRQHTHYMALWEAGEDEDGMSFDADVIYSIKDGGL